jgi:16S rRNA (cytosine967-C5)-methyltransferase
MPVTRAASPARRAAFRVVRRVFEQGAFADQALHAEADALDPRDRAFARRLAFGTVQRRRTLDHVIEQLAGRRKLDPPVRAALQLGLFQLLLLDGVPDHAAVDESVELAKKTRGAGLVNAVLRRAAREGPALLDAIEDEATLLSYPTWLATLWREAYGAETASALMHRLNEPPELALRANRLKTTPEDLAAALGGQSPPEQRGQSPLPSGPETAPLQGEEEGQSPGGGGGLSPVVSGGQSPDAVVVVGAFDAYAHPLWEAGHFMPQSRSSQAVARAVGALPGERVLDLCAAPGRQDDAPRRAHGGRRASSRRAPRRPRGRPAAHVRADGGVDRPDRRRRRRRAADRPARTTACWPTRRAAASARCRPARTCAGA